MDSVLNAQIEAQAKELLTSIGALVAPVPVEEVAGKLGLKIEAAALGDDVSGILVVEGGRGVIGYNQSHPYVRQRFSIAHEIGHFVLHQTQRQLFIDKVYTAVYRRDQTSSSGEHLCEIQANEFAAALLMPEELILKEVSSLEFDLGDEEALTALAKTFQVSSQAMSLRLAHLRIFPSYNS